jgi:tRNA A-37 threonylcarbamoyl transferase component Bud32
MPSNERPPAGSGNGRLALAVLAMSPAIAATYAQALIERRRSATVIAVRRALETLGLHDLLAGSTIEARALGSGKSNAVVAVTLTSAGRPPRRLVVKRALAFGSVMAWGARHFGANYVYGAATSSAARITREAAALRMLASQGIAVPRCLAADADHALLALEWIDGTPAAHALHGPDAPHRAREIGALLRRVHDIGVTLADGHPGNMMIARDSDRLVLFDLEFAECNGSTPARRGFDLAYAGVLMPAPALCHAMLDAYGARSREEQAALDEAERHLRRFGRLLEMERARWAPAASR